MTSQRASCRCGQLSALVTGDPVRVSVCHCLNCQKRSGSAFAAQARWPEAQVVITGKSSSWTYQHPDSGNRVVFHFCPDCGSTVHYHGEGKGDGQLAIAVGAFDDPYFLKPRFSMFEERRHDWVAILGDDVGHVH